MKLFIGALLLLNSIALLIGALGLVLAGAPLEPAIASGLSGIGGLMYVAAGLP